MWYIKLHVRDAVSSMLAKPADMLPLEFWSIKRRISKWDSTSLNVVVQRVILNGIFLIHVARMKTNDNRSNLHQKAETAINYARWVPGAGKDIEVVVQMQEI